MNRHAQAWLRALRSGEYRQTRGRLEGEGAYCCLGVACHLAIEAGVSVTRGEISTGEATYNGQRGMLPDSVRDWLGLATGDGAYGNECLTNDNDAGKSFGWLADIIESEPAGMFELGAHSPEWGRDG